jgi:hypothetical protein
MCFHGNFTSPVAFLYSDSFMKFRRQDMQNASIEPHGKAKKSRRNNQAI